MGLVWGTVDLETTYNFKIMRDGVDIPGFDVEMITESIPGKHGIDVFDQVMRPRTITIKGLIQGTSASDLQSKIEGLNAELFGGYGTAPTNYVTSGVTEKDLTIPGFTNKFPALALSMSTPKWIGPRLKATVAEITLKFFQRKPYGVV